MSSSENNTEKNTDFGFVLADARKSQNYSVNDICEQLRIPKHVIDAIEANDIEALPAPTYTQGYIRAYAKFLEIAGEDLLAMYNQAVPHARASTLKPRSSLPDEASSQSPVVKAVTILLIVGGIAAILYGSFQYYQEKADVMESELESKERSFTGNSLDSPGSMSLSLKQNTATPAPMSPQLSDVPAEAVEITEQAAAEEEDQPVVQNDNIEIIAEKGSWVEVRDATRARLLYNMVPSGESRVLQGRAPFRISMGNAKSTRVVINDIEIDIADYIRSNNTASFSVSSEGENIIFH